MPIIGPRPIRLARIALPALAAAVALLGQGRAVAIVNAAVTLPASLANDVVRLQAVFTLDLGPQPNQKIPLPVDFSGVIVNTADDGNGGTFYDVLTADHALRVPNPFPGALTKLSLGFRGDTTYPIAVADLTKNVVLGRPVDLALIAFDIPKEPPPKVVKPADLAPVSIGAPSVTPGNRIAIAGYGANATLAALPGLGTAYQVTAGSGGTYVAGANTLPANAVMNDYQRPAAPAEPTYKFKGIQATFALSPGNDSAPDKVTRATAFFFGGDSGGPTFQNTDVADYKLIGTHSGSASTNLQPNGNACTGAENEVCNDYAGPGATWTDVNLSQYGNFIAMAERTANVAEPAPVDEPATGWLLAAALSAGAGLRRHWPR